MQLIAVHEQMQPHEYKLQIDGEHAPASARFDRVDEVLLGIVGGRAEAPWVGPVLLLCDWDESAIEGSVLLCVAICFCCSIFCLAWFLTLVTLISRVSWLVLLGLLSLLSLFSLLSFTGIISLGLHSFLSCRIIAGLI